MAMEHAQRLRVVAALRDAERLQSGDEACERRRGCRIHKSPAGRWSAASQYSTSINASLNMLNAESKSIVFVAITCDPNVSLRRSLADIETCIVTAFLYRRRASRAREVEFLLGSGNTRLG